MVVPELIFFSGAEVTLWFPVARSMPLFAAPTTASATVGPPTVRHHVAKAKAAVTSIYIYLLADPAGGPSDFHLGRLD